MKNILSEDTRSVLDTIARERMLVAFDFDGTLAPIVDDPGAAAMREGTRRLLRLVSLLYPCAVISGRSRTDLAPRLDAVPLVAVVGNHGAEAGYGPVDTSVRERVARWAAQARARLREHEGVEVEDKGLSIALHYRRARSLTEAEQAVRATASVLEGACVFDGHLVVNVVPPDQHDKGEALREVLDRVGERAAVFIGDDATDEDAFRSEAVRVAIRVGASSSSAAPYFVETQAHVDDLLRALVSARRRADGLPDDAHRILEAMV